MKLLVFEAEQKTRLVEELTSYIINLNLFESYYNSPSPNPTVFPIFTFPIIHIVHSPKFCMIFVSNFPWLVQSFQEPDINKDDAYANVLDVTKAYFLKIVFYCCVLTFYKNVKHVNYTSSTIHVTGVLYYNGQSLNLW